MDLKEKIQNYTPFNEQEEADKKLMLYYLNTFDDCLTRENKIAHFTSSGFIVNKTRDKVLFIYHNIYNSWAWTGGHADGEEDLLQVAIREAKEETGIEEVNPVTEKLFALDILPVSSHIKKGKFVSSHVDLNATYLLEADDDKIVRPKLDENKAVNWLPIDHLEEYVSEKHMLSVYDKVIEKLKKLPNCEIHF